MLQFGMNSCGRTVIWYAIWAALCEVFSAFIPGFADEFADSTTLRILTFLLGMLTTMMLSGSVACFKTSLQSLLDFQAEMRAFWYFIQVRVIHQDAARFVFDCHMIAFAVSCSKAIIGPDVSEAVDYREVYDKVLLEFRQCCLLQPDDPTYSVITSDPALMELVLWSWLRVLGRVDYEACVRWSWVRAKLDTMLTAQFMHPPDTTLHLMNTVCHMLLIVMPTACQTWPTKLVTPGITFVMIALLHLSEELQQPLSIGLDMHHLPWKEAFSTVCQCRVLPEMKPLLRETINFFNKGCRTNTWDEEEAKRIFGDEVNVHRDHNTRVAYSTGNLQLGIYMTEPLLRTLDCVGGQLFPETKRGDIARTLPNYPEIYQLRRSNSGKRRGSSASHSSKAASAEVVSSDSE